MRVVLAVLMGLAPGVLFEVSSDRRFEDLSEASWQLLADAYTIRAAAFSDQFGLDGRVAAISGDDVFAWLRQASL